MEEKCTYGLFDAAHNTQTTDLIHVKETSSHKKRKGSDEMYDVQIHTYDSKHSQSSSRIECFILSTRQLRLTSLLLGPRERSGREEETFILEFPKVILGTRIPAVSQSFRCSHIIEHSYCLVNTLPSQSMRGNTKLYKSRLMPLRYDQWSFRINLIAQRMRSRNGSKVQRGT